MFFWLEPKEPKVQVPAKAPPPERLTHRKTLKFWRCFLYSKGKCGDPASWYGATPEALCSRLKFFIAQIFYKSGREQGADRVFYFEERAGIYTMMLASKLLQDFLSFGYLYKKRSSMRNKSLYELLLSKEQNDEVCDATKMLREQKLVTKDCFGFASQDDSSLASGETAGYIKIVLLFIISFLTFGGMTASAQDDSIFIRKLADEILVNGKAYDNLRHLTKQIGPRLAGSQGMVKSEQWGLKMMKESGADKAWMQECMVPHWVRGGKDEMWCMQFVSSNNPAKPDGRLMRKYLDVVALGNSIGTGKNGLEAEVVLVNSFDELEKVKDKVKGKIVFYNYKFNDAYVNTFLAYRDAGQYRGQGPSRASKYGAKAVIVRSMSNATDNNPHTGATRYDSAYAKIPAVAIGLRDADWLADVLKKGSLNISMKTNGHFLPDTIGHNIIGELRGTEFPDEIITVGGHLDCWDNCEGAHDDGAGCVQTIEILRALKAIGYKPKRTIRFVLFANEENGLRGGNKYAEEAKAKNEKHILAMESDAGGFTPRALGFTGSDAQFEKFMSWKSLIAPYGCSEFVKGGGGADIGPLNRSLKTPMASLNPDTQRYFDIHHARSDVFESVNKRELLLGAVNMAALIYLVDKYGL